MRSRFLILLAALEISVQAFPFFKTKCEEVLTTTGNRLPYPEVLREGQDKLRAILDEHVWLRGYTVVLSTLGDGQIEWATSSDGRELVGQGVWTPAIGFVRVQISQDAPTLAVDDKSYRIEFLAEVFVDPEHFENAEAVIAEAGAATRRERASGDFPNFMIDLKKEVLTEGPHQGLVRIAMPLSALANRDGGKYWIASFRIGERPYLALFIESFLRHFRLAADEKPFRKLP